jgi:hypothetical protein
MRAGGKWHVELPTDIYHVVGIAPGWKLAVGEGSHKMKGCVIDVHLVIAIIRGKEEVGPVI